MTRIIDFLYNNIKNSPDKIAVYCEDKEITYKDFGLLVNKFSNMLLAQGVKHLDNIGVLLPNNIDFIALIFAAANIGAAITPLSPTLPESAILQLFDYADVKHVVGTNATLSNVDISKFNAKIITDSDDFKNSSEKEVICEEVKGDEPLIFTMTSGSTGNPKPIVLSQKNKVDRAFSAINMYKVTKDDVVLAATPLYHSLAERLVIIPLILGATSVLMPRFSPLTWLNTVKDRAVTFTIAVSSQLRQISEVLTSPYLPEIGSLRCIASSSALLEDHSKRELIDKLKCDFHENYGTSEIACATNIDMTTSRHKMKSVGKAFPDVDVKILRKDNTFAPVGEVGEIVVKTPLLFMGYYKIPEKTKSSLFGEYFKTGDLGKMDEDGYLYFIDREKDLIISGGINVYPKDIEEVVSKYDSIIECAAFPYPDSNLGEVVALALVVKDDFQLRQFKFYCADNLADFQMPRKYFTLDALPRNNMGKLAKHKLVEMFVE